MQYVLFCWKKLFDMWICFWWKSYFLYMMQICFVEKGISCIWCEFVLFKKLVHIYCVNLFGKILLNINEFINGDVLILSVWVKYYRIYGSQ